MTRSVRSCLIVLVGIVSSLAVGCGSSETRSVAPEPENPFVGYLVGDEATLEVVTWNLHNFAEDANAAEVALIAQAISAMGADVVALQEIAQANRFDELVAALPGWSGHRATSDQWQNLAFVWLDSTVTVRTVAEIRPDVDEAWRPFPRWPLLLEITWQGHDLALVNNHFKCCGDGQLDLDDAGDEETRRLDASRLLHDHIEAAYPEEAVILLGDLNDRLDDSSGDNVFTPFFDRPDRYRFADLAIAEGPSNSWSYGPWLQNPSHLDHILVTAPLFAAFDGPGGACRTLRLDQALDSGEYRELVSDHVPVVMVLPGALLP